MAHEAPNDAQISARKPGRSLFGPVILIAIGVFLLLGNLGLLPDLNWRAALRLWPLLLIFGGLNIIVRQVSRPIGTLLSGLVALTTVAVFSFVLLYSGQIPILERFGSRFATNSVEEQVSFPAAGVDSASIAIHLNEAGADVEALNDSSSLLEADISHRGRLIFDSEVSDSRATINLGTTGDSDRPLWNDPVFWLFGDDLARWQVGLNPNVPLELQIDIASSSTDLDLSQLALLGLVVNGGSGSARIVLPGGNHDSEYDVGSGSVELTLPDDGRHQMRIDGGTGSLAIRVPSSLELRLEVADGGTGGLHIDERFVRVEQVDGDNERVWISDNFEDAQDYVDLYLNVGTGGVSIEAE